MKFNFKKISAVMTSFLMLGATASFAAAANYPKPFIEGSTANVAIVYGSAAAPSDATQAGNIKNDLAKNLGGEVTVEGGVSLSGGTDKLYLGDTLRSEVQTITKDDFPNILSDGIFTDDDGEDFDYSQMIDLGDDATFGFTNSDGDLDNPALQIELPEDVSATNYVYSWRVDMDDTIDFTHSDSESQEITLFGKKYTVGTGTTEDVLELLGGSDEQQINVGETKTLTINGDTYEVRLDGISENSDASITVDGDSKIFGEAETKTVGGVEVYVKTIFRTDANQGYVRIQLGADKLLLEDGQEVVMGADEDDVDGTYVRINEGGGNFSITDKIEIFVGVEDSDVDDVLEGKSFVDPVFENLNLVLQDIKNAPDFDGNKGTDVNSDRRKITFSSASDQCVQVEFKTNQKDSAEKIEFAYNSTGEVLLADDKGNEIHVVEGASFSENEYIILNSGGEYQHFMEVVEVNTDDGILELRDLFFSDDKDNIEVKGSGLKEVTTPAVEESFNIRGKGYKAISDGADKMKVYSDDYDGLNDDSVIAVYPYLEPYTDRNFRIAFTDDVMIADDYDDSTSAEVVFELPTGKFSIDSDTTDTIDIDFDDDGNIDVNNQGNGTVSLKLGEVYYLLEISVLGTVDLTLSIDSGQDEDTNDVEEDPGLLFLEEEDNSDGDAQNAVIIPTEGMVKDGDEYAHIDLSGIEFTKDPEYEEFDDSDFTGMIDSYGTYVLKDSDPDQNMAVLSYPKDQMYFDVVLASSESVTTGSSGVLGGIVVKDTEISSVSSKNLIVVGGSCINQAAATLLGGTYCEDGFSSNTGGVGSGEFIIKGYADSTLTTKHALLVAGYEAGDTANAATYLMNKPVDTDKTYIGTSGNEATMQVE